MECESDHGSVVHESEWDLLGTRGGAHSVLTDAEYKAIFGAERPAARQRPYQSLTGFTSTLDESSCLSEAWDDTLPPAHQLDSEFVQLHSDAQLTSCDRAVTGQKVISF